MSEDLQIKIAQPDDFEKLVRSLIYIGSFIKKSQM